MNERIEMFLMESENEMIDSIRKSHEYSELQKEQIIKLISE